MMMAGTSNKSHSSSRSLPAKKQTQKQQPPTTRKVPLHRRGSGADALPKQPGVVATQSQPARQQMGSKSEHDNTDTTPTKSRRALLTKVKSAGCICGSASAKSMAREETERGDTERCETEREQTERGGDHNDDDVEYVYQHDDDNNDDNDVQEDGNDMVEEQQLSQRGQMVDCSASEARSTKSTKRRNLVRSLSHTFGLRRRASTTDSRPIQDHHQQDEEEQTQSVTASSMSRRSQRRARRRRSQLDQTSSKSKRRSLVRSLSRTFSFKSVFSRSKKADVDFEESQQRQDKDIEFVPDYENHQGHWIEKEHSLPASPSELYRRSSRRNPASSSTSTDVTSGSIVIDVDDISSLMELERQRVSLRKMEAAMLQNSTSSVGTDNNLPRKRRTTERVPSIPPVTASRRQSHDDGRAPPKTRHTAVRHTAARRDGRPGLVPQRGRSVKTLVSRRDKNDPRHLLFQDPPKRRAKSLEVWERRGSF